MLRKSSAPSTVAQTSFDKVLYLLGIGLVLNLAVSLYTLSKVNPQSANTPTAPANTKAIAFETTKQDKPELRFFVMSFCPYGNQIEDVIKPVADLLGDKADIRPGYIFDKVDNLNSYCQTRSGDASKCADYVTSGYFKTEAECKTTISQNLATCLDEKNYLKAQNGAYYASLHGRSEANQNVREICAWNQTDDKKKWWDFIARTNSNCTTANVDSCWTDQAKAAGFDTNQITDCFNTQASQLIDKEIADTTKYDVSGSPTLLLNGAAFPSDNAYSQDGTGGLKIGKKTYSQNQYRTANFLKDAVCAGFDKAPKECNTTLDEPAVAGATAGGC